MLPQHGKGLVITVKATEWLWLGSIIRYFIQFSPVLHKILIYPESGEIVLNVFHTRHILLFGSLYKFSLKRLLVRFVVKRTLLDLA